MVDDVQTGDNTSDGSGSAQTTRWDVIVVGGGFAGVAAAQQLGQAGVDVLLIDANDYHQFQPLLYQVATSQIGITEVARPLRSMFRRQETVRVAISEVTRIDAAARTVTLDDGSVCTGRVLVVATGAQANFFGITGAAEHSYPLYSLDDAVRLAGAMLSALDEADRLSAPRDPIDLVVVGGGATGVEFAGAVAESLASAVAAVFPGDLAARTTVHLVDMVPTVLGPFAEKSQKYARGVLESAGVRLHLGKGVTEVHGDGVTLEDGTRVPARMVVWAGGLKGRDVLADSGLPLGRGGRVDVAPDLTVAGLDGVYALGDSANITDGKGRALPQLGSVAQQSGKWAARNILADLSGRPRTPFAYRDKGIMAMIGRGAAVAEVGPRRWQIKGPLAFIAWLGVHAALLSGVWQRVGAVASWSVGYFTKYRPQAMIAHVAQDLRQGR
ncbi:NAD(P)/FAD-dependent oxidoreductase [Tomitella fengzijianii]|uniref:NAD(P)/FAD-dependent oxidoreductase n=1 Tax=Tomitella fengzijianii TaxID=2597660 RepID=UPI0018EF02B5|nr:NAD(P)/FAD-dependent oxidoreductase [Tomitella fengzijianii]